MCHCRRPSLLAVLAGCIVVGLLAGQAGAIPAFPGAEGAGAGAMGGRFGDVYHVTSLSDANSPGTLRYGLNTVPPEGRTIVFDIGGVIWLTGDLRVQKDYVTVAGQTAPGDGIMLAGNGVGLANRNNIIFRHLAVRLGDVNKVDRDALGTANITDSIIDHCSVSWGVDETLSASNTNRLTVQWSIVSEGLQNSYHSEEPNVYQAHSMGSLLRYGSGQLSFHHNLYAHNNSRNPRVGDNLDLDWVNNVVYDGGTSSSGAASEGTPQVNYVGNYIVRGTRGPGGLFASGSSNTQIYLQGNLYDSDRDHVRDGTDPSWGGVSGGYTASATRFPLPATVVESAGTAYQRVLNEAGSRLHRDAVDLRIVNDVINETGTIIDSQEQVGGYPTYMEQSRSAGFDTDGDGMPDAWESAHGLNPGVDDHNADFDEDGYRNLEEYLHGLAPIPAPRAIVWTGGTAGRYELIGNWDIPWQPTLADRTEINSGKATVAYRFQEAGTLVVANAPGGAAELSVAPGGQLLVADQVILGSASGGRGAASLTGGSLLAGGAVVLASVSSSTGELKVGRNAYVQVGGLAVQEGEGRCGKVAVEIASGGSSLIRTSAASNLAGTIDVQVLNGWRPKEGDAFTVIASSDISGVHFAGNFSDFTSNITLGLPGGSAFGGAADGPSYELTFLGYTAGDANGDHVVDGGDLALLGGNWMQYMTGWGNCDFDGDGFVDGSTVVDGGDLALLSTNWMWSLPAPAGPGEMSIPEPAAAMLLALGGAGLVRRHRRGGAGKVRIGGTASPARAG